MAKALFSAFAFIFCILFSLSSFAVSQEELATGEERIVEVRLAEGGLLHDGLIIHKAKDNKWYAPLGELCSALEIFITPLPKLTGAEGFIIKESRTFDLRVAECSLKLDGEKIPYACNEVLAYEHDIYVSTDVLQKWLPASFDVDPYKSVITVTTREKIPAQERAERDNRSVGGKFDDANSKGFQIKPNETRDFEGPSIDQTLGWRFAKERTSISERSFYFDTAVGSEVLGMDGYTHFSGTTKQLDPYRLSLSRKDPDGNILGVMHATHIQLIDVEMPALPLVSVGGLRTGIALSNQPLGSTSTFSTQDFVGNLLPGWEVELYQNEVFLGRQIHDSSGRYAFRNIPLTYGLNQFRLAFYGPFGRRSDEYHSYQVGSNLQKTGVQTYSVGLGYYQSEPIFIAQTNRGLSDRITASVGAARLVLPEIFKKPHYGWIGLSGYMNHFFLIGSATMTDEGGKAFEGQVRIPMSFMNAGIRYTGLREFQSELYNNRKNTLQQYSQMAADTNFAFKLGIPFNTTFDYKKNRYVDNTIENIIGNKLSFALGPVYLSNNLSYNLQQPVSPLNGKLDGNLLINTNRIRLGGNYDRDKVVSLEAEFQAQLSKSYSFTVLAREQLQDKTYLGAASLNKMFRDFSLQSSAGYSSTEALTLGISVAMNITRDPYQDKFHFSPEAQATSGASSVSVFVDDNRNGKRDENEKGFADAIVVSPQKPDEYKVDGNGYTYLNQLPTYQPVDISLSGQSLQDPMLQTEVPGYRFFPRPSRVTQIELPLVYVGMIDGLVQVLEHKKWRPGRRLEVNLADEKSATILKTRTDRDGFYWFENVPPGRYFVRVAYESQKIIAPKSKTHEVIIPPHGALINGKNFNLEGLR